MKGHLLCIPCSLRTAYDIAAKATDDEKLQKKVIIETLKWLGEDNNLMSATPAMLHTHVFRLVQKITGNNDPFAHLKRESNRIAINLIPVLKSEFKKRDFSDAFKFAALGAICGNSIDFEVEGHQISLEDLGKSLLGCLNSDLALDDTPKLVRILSKAKSVLYLLDNAGEIAFDKFFIKVISENYPVKVLAAVKSGPILNDATMEDALQVRLDEVAEVIATGSDSIGLNMDECSEDFMKRLKEADIIIAKGQGYYESLTEIEDALQKPIAYMLRAKCLVVAKSLNVRQGSNVVKIVNYDYLE
ncbi:MAG: ARMT1-like domain-containing protein [Candidatus Bathyarchaeia archaeon]